MMSPPADPEQVVKDVDEVEYACLVVGRRLLLANDSKNDDETRELKQEKKGTYQHHTFTTKVFRAENTVGI